MMPEYFVDKVGKLLQNFGFEAYWPNKPIKILELNTTIKRRIMSNNEDLNILFIFTSLRL